MTKSEIKKYFIVGVVTTLIGWAIFWLFSDVLGFSALIVSIAYTPLNFFWRFWMNKSYVFGNGFKFPSKEDFVFVIAGSFLFSLGVLESLFHKITRGKYDTRDI